jgi:hypothetical protein
MQQIVCMILALMVCCISMGSVLVAKCKSIIIEMYLIAMLNDDSMHWTKCSSFGKQLVCGDRNHGANIHHVMTALDLLPTAVFDNQCSHQQLVC